MIVLCRFRHAHDLVVSRLRRRSLGSDSVDDLTIRPWDLSSHHGIGVRAHSPSGELQRDMIEPARKQGEQEDAVNGDVQITILPSSRWRADLVFAGRSRCVDF
jgi:hypothetical protein